MTHNTLLTAATTLSYCLKLQALSDQLPPYIYWARCRYGIKYPIGWCDPAILAMEINHILAETRTAWNLNVTPMT